MLISLSPPVIEVSTLSVGLIEALAKKDVLAVRVPSYCGPDICAHVTRRAGLVDGVGYADEPTFKKIIGGAVYDAAHDPDQLLSYLNSASSWIDDCRNIFLPYMNPAERLRCDLDGIWPHGCQVERFRGRPAFSGLLRAFDFDAEARVHQDMVHWDIPDVPESVTIRATLSCVMYFSCSSSGGELELWDRGYTDHAEYQRSQVPGDYAIDRANISVPTAVLTPQVGEMIIFNAQNLHAVRKNTGGDRRLTQSLFVSYRGKDYGLGTFS